MRQRQPRDKNDAHLKYIRTLGCLLCGDDTTTESAHVAMIDRSVAKGMTSMAGKADDRFTVPMCGTHHWQQHDAGNERDWWMFSGLDPIKVALALYSVTGDYARGCEIVSACRERVAA